MSLTGFTVFARRQLPPPETDPVLRVFGRVHAFSEPAHAAPTVPFAGVKVFFAGTLFNREALRRQHGIANNTPEGVIAALYSQHGDRIASLLDGAFAVAIVDESKVVTFRDQTGLEQIYYYASDGEFFVSTSLHQIKRLIRLRVRESVLPRYFLLHQINNEDTLLEGVYQVKIGEVLTIDVSDARISQKTSDHWPYREFLTTTLTDQQIMDRYRDILTARIKSLIGGLSTPLVFNAMSGGNDSTLIQCILCELGFRNSICANYTARGLDAKYSMGVARNLATHHTVVEIDDQSFFNSIVEGVRITEQPLMFEGQSMFNLMYAHISNVGGDGTVKVCFDGNGADAVLGSRLPLILLHHLQRHPSLSAVLFQTAGQLAAHSLRSTVSALLKGIRSQRYDASFYFAFGNLTNKAEQVRRAFGLVDIGGAAAWDLSEFQRYPGDIQEKAYRLQVFHFNGNQQINTINYKLARHNGVTLLHPFVDRELIQFMCAVPTGRKVQRFTEKYYTRKLLERYIPKPFIYRRKTYKSIPWLSLFQNNRDFKNLVEEFNDRRYGYFDFREVNVFGTQGNEALAKKLLNFHLWHKRFIDQ